MLSYSLMHINIHISLNMILYWHIYDKIGQAKSKDLGDDQWEINFQNELIDGVYRTAESGLIRKETKDKLWF